MVVRLYGQIIPSFSEGDKIYSTAIEARKVVTLKLINESMLNSRIIYYM